MLIISIIAFAGGAIYGSFLNALLWRLPTGRSMNGRSECPNCHHTLGWLDLFPIASYAFLGGRCRYCRHSINPRYLYIELAAGLLGTGIVFFHIPGTPVFLALQIIVAFALLALTVFDLLYMILPDAIILPTVLIISAYHILYTPAVAEFFLTGLLIGSFFAILHLVSRGTWIGFGDAKLGFLIGLMFGYPLGVLVVIGGIWIGAAWALALLAARKASMKTSLPLGTFLTGAGIACLLLYQHIFYVAELFR
ncbi:MAG TPA: prepilin peptidase [Candidatus Paceibacterota bacterium]|nr:prepilin peptidase [Candidatus Paceibacterota bacterium]